VIRLIHLPSKNNYGHDSLITIEERPHWSDPSENMSRHFDPPIGGRTGTAPPQWGERDVGAAPAVITTGSPPFWIVPHLSLSGFWPYFHLLWSLDQTLGRGPIIEPPRNFSVPPSLGRGRVVPPQYLNVDVHTVYVRLRSSWYPSAYYGKFKTQCVSFGGKLTTKRFSSSHYDY